MGFVYLGTGAPEQFVIKVDVAVIGRSDFKVTQAIRAVTRYLSLLLGY